MAVLDERITVPGDGHLVTEPPCVLERTLPDLYSIYLKLSQECANQKDRPCLISAVNINGCLAAHLR